MDFDKCLFGVDAREFLDEQDFSFILSQDSIMISLVKSEASHPLMTDFRQKGVYIALCLHPDFWKQRFVHFIPIAATMTSNMSAKPSDFAIFSMLMNLAHVMTFIGYDIYYPDRHPGRRSRIIPRIFHPYEPPEEFIPLTNASGIRDHIGNKLLTVRPELLSFLQNKDKENYEKMKAHIRNSGGR